MITLKAEARDVKVNPKLIRKKGVIPAVFYGSGKTSTAISVNKLEFTKLYAQVGETAIINLETPAGKLDVLVHDVARDVVTGEPIHIDFYVTAKDHKIQVNVPLEFIGVSPAEKEGGVITKVMHELHIEALPAKLPQHITIDLAMLMTLNSHIAVADLKLGDGVKALVSGTELVALIALPNTPKEDLVAALDISSIEVEKKGKKDEDKIEEKA